MGGLPYRVSKEAAGMGMLPLPAVNWLVRCFENFGLGNGLLALVQHAVLQTIPEPTLPLDETIMAWGCGWRIDDVRPPMCRAFRAQVSLCPRPYNVRA